MQSVKTDSIKKKRYTNLAASALLAGMAAFSFTGCDSTDSPPSCTTTNDPTALITLTSPTCGTSFKVGSTMNVTWSVKDDDNAPNAVDLMMSVDSGKTWGFMRSGSIPETSPSWGNFPWVVKESITIDGEAVSLAGKKAWVRVMQYSVTDPKLISSMVDPITITAP